MIENKNDNKALQFGEFIRQTRLEKNISLRKFANMVNLSPTFISKMEVGEFKPPKEENIIKIAEILSINKDTLLAMAGKVSSDLQNKIQTSPELFASFLRRVSIKKLEKNWNEIECVLDDEDED